MNRLIIKNIGPIKDIDLDLNKINVFIGPQGSGKSTIAKIISFCSWLEKDNSVTEQACSEGLIARLTSFHHMEGYFSQESELLYEGDNIAFIYNWKTDRKRPPLSKVFGGGECLPNKAMLFHVDRKNVNPKVAYIPAERNFVSAVPSLRNYSDKDDNLQSFVNDWFEAKRHYTRETPIPIMSLGLDYFYNPGTDADYLLQENASNTIPLVAASSGYQSIVPLVVLLKWLSSGIYEENKPFSPAENEKVRTILAHLSDISEKSNATIIERLRGFLEGRVYSHTQFIIEEPEQNLFPRTQMDLLYQILSEINHGRNHRLVLTTHSPYILYALNNCILAHIVEDSMDKKLSKSLECAKYAVAPKDVSVWSIHDGCIRNENNEYNKTIQDRRGLVRKNYFNDVMKDVMNEFNTMLPYID